MGSGNAWSRRLLLFLLVCGVLLASWHVIYESRRSPLDVAESRSVIEQPYQVVYEADFDHARLYLLKTADEYQTVWCSRDLFRWTSHMAQSTPFAGAEPILTVSSMSFSKGDAFSLTFFAVVVSDKSICYIEAGPAEERVRREVANGGLVLFTWQAHSSQFQELPPLALSSAGEVLYRYEARPTGGTIRLPDDFKWYRSDVRPEDPLPPEVAP